MKLKCLVRKEFLEEFLVPGNCSIKYFSIIIIYYFFNNGLDIVKRSKNILGGDVRRNTANLNNVSNSITLSFLIFTDIEHV